MTRIAPKRYQHDAVDQALEIFRYAEGQIRRAPDAQDRRIASAYNGCVLLEAPTGSGKTLMAGMIAEALSQPGREDNPRMVWFWFTPFKGLVDQARGALKKDFPGLRVRDLQIDRTTRNARSGDCFVTTWAAVAANNQETRRVRKSSDANAALDDFIAELRQDGFRIGAVVDEAHHTFFKATSEAVRFYREVLAPEFTLMVTATPNDRDIERFKQAGGIVEVHRNAVSRQSAVDAGLIKEGVQSVAFLAGSEQQTLVNFAENALGAAWATHQEIARGLRVAGIDLVPLMLVQVGNSDQAVAEAKSLLMGLGVAEAGIASYTAKEPTNDLLAVALDEQFEVLIFKVAVALGFDAPRAFVLAALRGAKDTDFGIQVVGRILRVHRLLQPGTLDGTLPTGLRRGYCFLADADNQAGLTSAGERINAIRDELAKICPSTIVVQVGGETQVQVAVNGQASLFRVERNPSVSAADPDPAEETAPMVVGTGLPVGFGYSPPGMDDLFDGTGASLPNERSIKHPPRLGQPMAAPAGAPLHPLRADAQAVLKTERMPISTSELLACIAARIGFDDTVINAGLRVSVTLTRKTIGVFDGSEELAEAPARLEAKALAARAQSELLHFGCLHPAHLFEALLGRLRTEFRHRGLPDDEATLERALNLLMATQPALLRRVERECAGRFKEVVDAGRWPAAIPAVTERSRLNVYGVIPDGLNAPELAFAALLDADMTGIVEYWYRNEPHKPWSVAVVRPTGYQFFPDFIVKVKGRIRGGGFVLVETKGDYLLNSTETIEKVNAEHKFYGPALFLKQDGQGRFMTVRYIEKTNRCEEDQVFRLENLAGY